MGLLFTTQKSSTAGNRSDQRVSKYCADRLGRLGRDQRGIAAVEFTLIAPLMIALWLGSFEISQAVSADRRVTHAASALADLITQQTNVTAAEMDDIMDATIAIMRPFGTDNVSIEIAGIQIDEDGGTEIVWSETRGGSAPLVGGTYEIPEGLAVPDTFLVVAELTLSHTPPTAYAITGTIDLTDRFFLRPRRSPDITYEG